MEATIHSNLLQVKKRNQGSLLNPPFLYIYFNNLVGSAVYFGENDPDNACVPLPLPIDVHTGMPLSTIGMSKEGSKMNLGSLSTKEGLKEREPPFREPSFFSTRAELYASLLAVYIVTHKKFHSLCSDTNKKRQFGEYISLYKKDLLVIKQDSIVAIELLRHCQTLKKAPSLWCIDGKNSQWQVKFDWDQVIYTGTIYDHQDILDWWWMCTRGRCVNLQHVKAHRDEKEITEIEMRDYIGNEYADLYAKDASKIDLYDYNKRSVGYENGYPLFAKWR